jgi:type IV secretion system protein VirB8
VKKSDNPEARAALYREGETWANDRDRLEARQLRTAWLIAGGATVVALCEAAALVALAPLKTAVPYTLLVDRQTGYVEALKPLERETIAPDRALTRSFLAQYVIARESFAIDSLKDDYRKVALWSAGEARDRYVAGMQATNPASPLATLPRRALVSVTINSVSSLNADTSLVRFTTTRADLGAQDQPSQHWAAVITWRYSGAEMTADDRLLNPLGFQVTRYRRDAETVPEPAPPPVPVPVIGRPGPAPAAPGPGPGAAITAVPR